jgi:glycosyltransferase involved in cell wall biosynthesis
VAALESFNLKLSSNPIRVAVDLTAFNPGGASGGLKPFALGFLQWITENRGGEFIFIYFTRPPFAPEVEGFRRPVDWNICIGEPDGGAPPGGSRPGLVWAPEAETGWFERWPADLLYTPWGFSSFYRPGLPSVNLVVDTLHRDWPGLLPPEEVAERERWFRQMLPRADAVVCISDFVRRQVHLHFAAPIEKLFVIHTAIQERLLPAAAEKRSAPPDRPYFFYPANDWPHKNHRALIDAYAAYQKRAGEAAWDLVLSGHFARAGVWREQLAVLGIEGRCRVLGYIDRDDLATVFREAGALVFPSLYEGFGIPVLEAMALGVPVACSRAASLPEIAGEAALFFDPSRNEDIAQALDRIAGDAALRRRLSAAGLERAKTFSISREAGLLADRFIAAAAL